MNQIVPFDAARIEQANEVMELYGKGYKPLQIAKQLGLRRKDVDEHIEEWKDSVRGSQFIRDRVEELLVQLDEHFSELQRQLHWTLDAIPEDTRDPQLMAQRTAAVKALTEIATKRIDALQKAGLLDAADMGNEIAEAEANIDAIKQLLKEVIEKACPADATFIRDGLSRLSKESVGSPVV